MDLINLILIALPEIISVLIFIYILLDKTITKKEFLYSVLIYLITFYIMKNIVSKPISSIVAYFTIMTIVHKFSKSKFVNCVIATVLTMALKFILEWIMIFIANSMGISLDIILNYRLSKIIMCNITVVCMFIISYFIIRFKIKNGNSKDFKFYINKDIEYIIILANILIMIVLAIPIIYIYSIKDIYSDLKYFMIGFLIFLLVISC
ncbi:MAG: hypothetical protein ACRCX2_35370, partial [Paraclostridium sp.]